jgi:hypothetical protein
MQPSSRPALLGAVFLLALAGTVSAVRGQAEKPDNKTDPREAKYTLRLQAASQITDQALKAEALTKIAEQAATEGLARVVKRCTEEAPPAKQADVIVQVAPLLAESGQEAAALELAAMVSPPPRRDELLKRLAAGPTDGVTPLMRATGAGLKELVSELVDKGADVHAVNKDGQTALILAATLGRAEIVQILLEKGGADVDAKTPMGATALILAADQGHVKVVRALLERNAKVNLKASFPFPDSFNKWSALQRAVKGEHSDVVEVLVEKGALTAEALEAARTAKQLDMVELITQVQKRTADKQAK